MPRTYCPLCGIPKTPGDRLWKVSPQLEADG